MDLKEKTVSGLIWAFIQQFGVQGIGFVITIILARLLTPAEFGLIAMLSVFIAIGNSLLEGGLSSSIIRTEDLEERDYSTVFFFNLAGSVVIYTMVYLAAPFIADFYRQAPLTLVLRIYALDFILNAFFGIQNAKLTRDMNFKLQMTIQIPAVLIGGLVGIVLALNGYGVWSLVWMHLFQSLISTVMHWVFSDWLPIMAFDRACFKRHFHFGYKMTLTGLLDILYRNIYILIIGKYYSATQLGFYSRADSLSQLPVSNLSAIVNKVTYPMFAKITQDDDKLKMVYQKIMKQVVFWNAPVLVFLAITAEPLFRCMLTSKWLPAVPYFQILCFAGIMYPLHAYNLNILKVKGRSDLILKLELLKKGICVISILAVIPFGIYGLLYFQLLFNFVGYAINSLYSGKLINYPMAEQIRDLLPLIGVAFMAGCCCYLFDHFCLLPLYLNDIFRIILNGTVYFLAYTALSTTLRLTPLSDFKQLILKR
jgi:O-antigen/teichoic acid export membrane protein